MSENQPDLTGLKELYPGKKGLLVDASISKNGEFVAKRIFELAKTCIDSDDTPGKSFGVKFPGYQAKEVEFVASCLQITISELIREAVLNFVEEAAPRLGMTVNEHGRLLDLDGNMVAFDTKGGK